MRKLLLIILCSIALLLSCTSKKKENEKLMMHANNLIEAAGNSPEKVLDAPLGFQFGWTTERCKQYLGKLSSSSIALLDSFPMFRYKFPNYKGLEVEAELFFLDDSLSRIVFKQIDNFEPEVDHLRNLYKLLDYLHFNGSISQGYKIPIEGSEDENNWDNIYISVKDNYVAEMREIRYSYSLTERVFIFSSQPRSKNLPPYKTKKEMEKGDNRIKEIVEKEILYKEYEEDIESNKHRIMVAVKMYLKDTLKDPDSYKSIEWGEITKYRNEYHVKHKYRAKNSFGGYVVEEYNFCVDSNWNVSILSDLY